MEVVGVEVGQHQHVRSARTAPRRAEIDHRIGADLGDVNGRQVAEVVDLSR